MAICSSEPNMGLIMKRILFVFLVLCSVSARAANPAFTDFNTNQFGTINNKVAIKNAALTTNLVVHESFIFKNGASTNFSITPVLTSASFLSSGVLMGGIGDLGGGTGYAWTFSTNVVLLNGPGSSFIGNAFGLTNILERNISVTTNIMGTSLVNFGNGTQVATNMSGDITFTGISGFVTSNLNWQAIDLNPNGAVRLITVPTDWWVSGFTNNTVVAIPAAGWAKLRVEALIGRCTNASIEIYQ